MLDYTGINCPVCNKEFTDKDDIVTCPKCGAPYHRHCYLEKGECVFPDLHENGGTWEPPVVEKPPAEKPSPYEVKDQECPRCGALNNHSSLFCSHCGSPLKIEPDSHNNSQYIQGNTNFPPIYGMGGIPVPFDPMGGINPTDIIDENINFGEVSKVVQQNTRYYMPIFSRIKGEKRSKFNFSAFLFSGGWLLYRKQYKLGIIYTILMFALYLGQTFTSLFLSYPRMIEILKQAGVQVDAATISYEQISTIALHSTPMDTLIIALPALMMLGMLIIMLILGFCGNRMYMKHCIKTINATRSTTQNSEDYNTRLVEKGGINTSVTLCLLICYFLCTYLPLLL